MAVQAVGTKLMIGSNSVAELTGIGGLDLSADTIETTTLDTIGGYKTFITGFKDAGEVSVSGYFNPNDTNGQMALYNAFNALSTLAFQIVFPSTLGAAWSFNGVVTNFKTDVQLEDAIPFECTIKVSGQPTLGLTQSTGLSALSLTGTGGTLTPSFSTGKYDYTFSGVTATSYTVTATGTGTINLFVDGALVQTLTSGAASSAISIATIGEVDNVTIMVQETGKIAKIYNIRVVKTA